MPDPLPYVGRFAPSPTGPLHFGSLIAALASYLDARANNGRWLLRIEDIDPPREQPGASAAIVDTLCRHGLHWDGDILYQSQRFPAYREALSRLQARGDAFPCGCTRAALAANGGLHRGRCRIPAPPCAVRLRVNDDDGEIAIDDLLQGRFSQLLARTVGDFVIWRKEDLPAYQLAVVVDDAAQGVTHVVRGSDLLDNTPRQVLLQRRLGLPTPRYAHLPVIANAHGQKLSKQTFARALDAADAAASLRAALDFLGQPAPPPARIAPAAILDWAVRHWSLATVPRATSLGGESLPASCRAFAG